LQGLVNRDVLVVRCGLCSEVDPLARITLELVTLLALDSGPILITQLTPDIIGINLGTGIGSRHNSTGSEVVGGEILNSPLRNLERTMALWTLDFPAGA